jgi:DNA (cytosine-5)-methyltransferase 1
MSVREAGLLQGFPRDFIFQGPFDDKFKQIGNAVPPPFSVALAQHLETLLNDNNTNCESSDIIQYIAKPITNSFSTVIGSLKKSKGPIDVSMQ